MWVNHALISRVFLNLGYKSKLLALDINGLVVFLYYRHTEWWPLDMSPQPLDRFRCPY